jgi:predicted DsbA family dithiol-disulfide isomerase
MESWSIGYDGDEDVERHASMPDHSVSGDPTSDSSLLTPKLLKLTAVSDYICPWCYVGFTRLERLHSEFEIDLELCAFELRPGTPPEGISRAEASKGRIYPPGYVENLLATARDAGIDMKRPPLIPSTRLAHEATEFANEHGKTWEIHRALFAAYFEHERDLGDIDVLCDVAAGIRLDPDALREALSSHRYAAEVQRQLDWSHSAGITGVPTVIFNGRFSLVGAQDYNVVQDVATRVLRLPAEPSAP